MPVELDFVLLTITHRGLEGQTNWSVEKAHLYLGGKWMWIPTIGDALVGRARSVACTNFLEANMAPYLIFLDSDIVFEPEDVQRLYQHLKNGYDLIGGTYVVRGGQQLAHYGMDGKAKLDGTIQEVKYLSTGFMGISKRLLEKIRDDLELPLCNPNDWAKCYPFFEDGRYKDDSVGWIYLSEDWDFCNKARAVGVVPYLDTGIRLGHQGVKLWKVEDIPEARREAMTRNIPPSKKKKKGDA